MQVQKKGIRVLGIAESYRGRERSRLCGVVMRRDLYIDGFTFGEITVGGSDATRVILGMIRSLAREDITGVMISGSVIAWYNIINPWSIMKDSGLPVISVSYEASGGLEEHIRHHFPDEPDRMSAYSLLGERQPVRLHTGHILYARGYGLDTRDVTALCRMFVHHGKIPEPCRVARFCARAAHDSIEYPA